MSPRYVSTLLKQARPYVFHNHRPLQNRLVAHTAPRPPRRGQDLLSKYLPPSSTPDSPRLDGVYETASTSPAGSSLQDVPPPEARSMATRLATPLPAMTPVPVSTWVQQPKTMIHGIEVPPKPRPPNEEGEPPSVRPPRLTTRMLHVRLRPLCIHHLRRRARVIHRCITRCQVCTPQRESPSTRLARGGQASFRDNGEGEGEGREYIGPEYGSFLSVSHKVDEVKYADEQGWRVV